MKLPFLCAVLAAYIPRPAGADSGAIARSLAAHSGITGAFVGWTTADRAEGAIAGLREQGGGASVEQGDLWQVGSLTKSMTAAGA